MMENIQIPFSRMDAPMHDTFAPPERVSIDATRLPWLCNEYLIACRKTASTRSINKYRQRINHFLKWSKSYKSLTETEMFTFAEYLAGSGLNERTQVDTVERVCQMFRWAQRIGIAKLDYSLWLPSFNAPKPVFKPTTLEDVQKLLVACAKTRYAVRNRALVAIMAGAGLRLEETVALNVEDVAFYADNIEKVYLFLF